MNIISALLPHDRLKCTDEHLNKFFLFTINYKRKSS